MAVLTNTEFTIFKRTLRLSPTARVEFRAAALSKQQFQAIFQAIEDWYVGGRAQAKTDMDTAAGETLTNALAKECESVYLDWKSGNL